MKNSKYIKVSASDQLPDESKYYETNFGRLFYNRVMKEFENEVFNPVKIEYWLEEKPDYEEEMKEMLEWCRNYIIEKTHAVVPDLETLLTKLKTE